MKIRREAWLEGCFGSSDSTREHESWSKLWKVKVPSKIKVLLWRLVHCSLPIADVLNHHNMATSSCCVVCGDADSWRHSLIRCTMALCVWALSEPELVEHMLTTAEPNAKAWILSMMELVSHAEFTKITVTLWAIWSTRRKPIDEGEHQSPLSTHMFISRYISDLQLVMSEHAISRTTPTRPRAWIPPRRATPR